jgi:hypothetical protein
MNLLPSLAAWSFAVAGLACAMGPLVIHLLNRRRFRTVYWGAMEFLREAVKRNRRIMEIRDLALLALRTLAVLLFGFALARPFLSAESTLMWAIVFPSALAAVLALIVATALWSHRVIRFLAIFAALLLFCAAGGGVAMQIARAGSSQQQTPDANQAVHAVLLVDNSLSMGRRAFAGTLLDAAKETAGQVIDKLPPGSRISVAPVCGSETPLPAEAYRTKDEALEALRRIKVVDRPASIQRALNEGGKAAEQVADMTPRLIFFTDQQAANWNGYSAGAEQEQVEMQIVEVVAPSAANVWIADLRLEDGLADVETPATITVELGYAGLPVKRSVQVSLAVDDADVATKTVDLEAGEGAREVNFQHSFTAFGPEPGKPAFVPLRATITPDELSGDDARHVVACVVAALPVVFVDQYGAKEENAIESRIGETSSLRRLLAPVASRGDSNHSLVTVRHVTIDQVDRGLLEDARLVVIAGLDDPGAAVPLLREYVEQGGQLLIAAGGRFDAQRWNASGWNDGAGILPTSLAAGAVGATPEEAVAALRPLVLDYESMAGHTYFELAGATEDELRDLYSEPYFFKVVAADDSEQAVTAFVAAELKRLEGLYSSRGNAAGGGASESGADSGADSGAERPDEWLLWGKPDEELDLSALPDEPRQRRQLLEDYLRRRTPRVLARLAGNRRLPYLVERRIGAGRVLLATSGLSSDWNTLPHTNTMLMFDRILREMVQSTMPQRNFEPRERITLPLPTARGDVSVLLARPGRENDREILDTGFIGERQRGVTVANALSRGFYRLSIDEAAASADPAVGGKQEEIVLAVNGPGEESNVTPLSPAAFEQRAEGSELILVRPGDVISLTGGKTRGQDTWWYLMLAVLVFLLVEIAILAWPQVAPQPATG